MEEWNENFSKKAHSQGKTWSIYPDDPLTAIGEAAGTIGSLASTSVLALRELPIEAICTLLASTVLLREDLDHLILQLGKAASGLPIHEVE
jgi:hypothetical protein